LKSIGPAWKKGDTNLPLLFSIICLFFKYSKNLLNHQVTAADVLSEGRMIGASIGFLDNDGKGIRRSVGYGSSECVTTHTIHCSIPGDRSLISRRRH